MIRVQHIGTSTIQGPQEDMPMAFDPKTHRPARGESPNHPAEDRALRAAGYKRLPRMWVPEAVCDEVIAMAEGYELEVRAIRQEAK